ncbi:hypothetical protein Ahy_A06g029825 [Arachis hypogaea]|uniref:Uncharacterized protein n=1 Tax=Arachis hypogaea TaxID=3818 RepID=A0A445CUD9_ARAHY|nr:hypothetical protein Ahy_A06g029825 [Arachis hypogaea]
MSWFHRSQNSPELFCIRFYPFSPFVVLPNTNLSPSLPIPKSPLSSRKDVVISFDNVNEAFKKINVPRICKSLIASFATLVPFKESASMDVVVRGKEKCYNVWMMKD